MTVHEPGVPPVDKPPPAPPGNRKPLPRELYVVRFIEGYGWPECTRRTHKSRKYERLEDVARAVAALAKFPTHHTLLDIHRIRLGDVTPLDPAVDLPDLPDDGDDDDHDD